MIVRVAMFAASLIILMTGAVTAQTYDCPALHQAESYTKWPSHQYLVEGRDGWLFRTQADLRTNFSFKEDAQKAFKQLNDALAARGTLLVIALIPTRGIIEGDNVIGDYDRGAAMAAYRQVANSMRSLGVTVASVEELKLPHPFFYQRDHHWRSAGAQFMANNVAELVKQSGMGLPRQRYKTEQRGIVPHKSAYDKPLKSICGVMPVPEQAEDFVTYLADDKAGLLGDVPQPQIVLAGTSNSVADTAHANFDGFLRQAIGADVLNVSVSGGGADQALLRYLSSDAYKTSAPKIIIWEFPVYQDFKSPAFLKRALKAAQSFTPSH